MVYTEKNNNLFVLVILNTQGCIFLKITPLYPHHHHPGPRLGKGGNFFRNWGNNKILDIKRQDISSFFDNFISTTLFISPKSSKTRRKKLFSRWGGEGRFFKKIYITANTFFSFCELCFCLIFSSLTLHLTFTVDDQVITLTIRIPPRYTEPWSNEGIIIIIKNQPTDNVS